MQNSFRGSIKNAKDSVKPSPSGEGKFSTYLFTEAGVPLRVSGRKFIQQAYPTPSTLNIPLGINVDSEFSLELDNLSTLTVVRVIHNFSEGKYSRHIWLRQTSIMEK